MKRLLLLFSVMAVAAWSAETTAVYNLGTLSASGLTISVNLARTAHKHTLQVATAGSPAGCSVQLEGSLDGNTWANLSGAQDCSSSVTFHVVDKPVTWIRANITDLSGGSSPTAAIRYVGIQ